MRRSALLALLLAGSFAFYLASPRAPRPESATAVLWSSAPAPPDALATRTYEHLLRGKRAAIQQVVWTEVVQDGRRLIRDETRTLSRRARQMAGVEDIFQTEGVTELLRTPEGELVYSKSVSREGGRTDTVEIQRKASGYRVVRTQGENSKEFEIECPPVMADEEAFLGPYVRRGAARPGKRFTARLLDVSRLRVVESRMTVADWDPDVPGLKVVATVDGNDTLLWFAGDGAIQSLRAGDLLVRRNDALTFGDLPGAPASFAITLPASHYLPRIFSARRLVVDIYVQIDETVRLPEFPENPFTERIERRDDRVRLTLTAHDDTTASARLPLADPAPYAAFLEATTLMEVDAPEVRSAARKAVAGETDARRAAARIADFVFRYLEKGSPPSSEPSAKEILALRTGDCSEHALLFVALCRAAGIPARRCSGYACIGTDWGAHAWAEIWVGRWIGADPTTNEIGTRARYIFCARPDEPDLRPASLNAERTRIVMRRAEWCDGAVDLGPEDRPDPALISGVVHDPLPPGWTAKRDGIHLRLRSQESRLRAFLMPDQGYRTPDILLDLAPGSREERLAGRPAVRADGLWIVPLGRENLYIEVDGEDPPAELLARLLRPTLERDGG